MSENAGVALEAIPQDKEPELQILESQVRLSECLLWRLMEDYYRQEGINAWRYVPSYVTNNRVIAESYAAILVEALYDALPALNFDEPLYILELGAGTGSFSKYFLQEFEARIADSPQLVRLPWRYVLTDFTSNCFSTWEGDPHLKTYLDQDRLDMAIFRSEEAPFIRLAKSGVTLSASTLKNPLVAIANYLFDSLKQDLFMAHQGKLSEVRLTLFRMLEGISEDDAVKLAQVKTFDTFKEIGETYYSTPSLNQLLADYRQQLNSAPFLFPLGAFQVIQNLQTLTQDNLILLSSDRGFTDLEYLENRGELTYCQHGGAFSFPVNYHAIEAYFKAQGGKSFSTTSPKFITSINILSAGRSCSWDRLRYAFGHQLARQNQTLNHCYLLELLRDPPELSTQMALDGCKAVMEIFFYEVRTLIACFNRLERIIPELNEHQREQLLKMLAKIEEQTYPVYQEPDPWLALANLYYQLNVLDKSQSHLAQSESFFGPTEASTQLKAMLPH
jgi:hypothetical protein